MSGRRWLPGLDGVLVAGAFVGVLSGATCLTAPRVQAQEAAPDAPDPAPPGTDIVCLLDVSRSVGRADPGAQRVAALQALLAVVTAGGGDRVAVAQWAGDRETRAGAVLLPWTPVPRSYEDQREVLDRIDAALAQAAATRGRASDWNAATGVALAELLDTRGEAPGRPVWVWLVSDGGLDPIEGDAVPDAYWPDPLPENGGLRTAVTERARELFETGPDGLARLLATDLTVTPIRLGEGTPLTPDLLQVVGERAGVPVHDLVALGPVGTARAALAAVTPAVHPAAGLVALFTADVELVAGETREVPVPAPEGVRPTVSLISAPPGMARVRPLLPGGGTLGVRQSADGAVQVIVWHRTIGRPRIAIDANGGAQGTVQIVHLAATDYVVALTLGAPGPFSADDVVPLQIALHQRGADVPLTAGAPLDDLVAKVELLDADGQVLLEQSVPLDDAVTCAGTAHLAVPAGAAGACSARVSVAGLRVAEDGPPLYRSDPATAAVPVRAPLAISFGMPRALVQQRVPVIGTPDGPRPAEDTVVAKIGLAADDPVPVTLTWNADARRYEGDWVPGRAGNASVVAEPSGSAVIHTDAAAGCQVQARSLHLLAAEPTTDTTPLQALTVATLDDGTLGARLRVGADLLAGEVGKARFTVADETGQAVAVAVHPDGGAAAPPDGLPLGPAVALVELRFPKGVAEGSRLTVRATLPGGEVTAPVALAVPPSGALFRIFAVVMAVLLLLVAGVLFTRHTTPHFERRLLRLQAPGRNVEHTRYLREFPRQGWGRVALGTPEAPRSVAFKLTGLRGVTPVACCIIPAKPYIRVTVNEEDVTGPRQLADGDQIVLKGATLTLRYTYNETDEEPAVVAAEDAGEDLVLQTRIETVQVPRELVRLAPNEFVLMHGHELQALLGGAPSEAWPESAVDPYAVTVGPDAAPRSYDPRDTADERVADEMDPNDTVDEDDALQRMFPVSPEADPADTLGEDAIHQPGPDAEPEAEPDPAEEPDAAAETLHDGTLAPDFDEEQLPDFLR